MDFEPREDDFLAESGDSEGRRARALIFVVAAGFLIVGAMSLAAYWIKCRHEHLHISVWHCLYVSIPLVTGIAILAMSSALARAIDEYLDE
jgi:uncharacterized protein (DUF983 family)